MMICVGSFAMGYLNMGYHGSDADSSFYAVNPDGTEKWHAQLRGPLTPPVVAGWGSRTPDFVVRGVGVIWERLEAAPR